LLGLTTIIVGVLGMALFQGDTNKVYALFIAQEPKDDPRPAPALNLRPMFTQIEGLSPKGSIDLIILEHPTEMGGAALFNVEVGETRLANTNSYAFERNGTLYLEKKVVDNNLGESILGAIGKVHFGWFGGIFLKIAYGLLGLGLTYLSVGGVRIWLARRRDKRNPAPQLERLWAITVWGQPVALATSALVAVLIPTGGTTFSLMAWGAVTLGSFALIRFFEPVQLLRIGRATCGVMLASLAVVHGGRMGLLDPVVLGINVTLFAAGVVLIWSVRSTPINGSRIG